MGIKRGKMRRQEARYPDLRDKVVVVTGGGSGIGFAIADAFAANSARVIIVGRNAVQLKAAVKHFGKKAHGIVFDVADVDRLPGLVDRIKNAAGEIDVLVNNAGRGHFASLEETTDETIRSMFAVNVYSLWHTTRPALPHMKARGSGHIINISSIAGKIGLPYNSAYVAAKHALK